MIYGKSQKFLNFLFPASFRSRAKRFPAFLSCMEPPRLFARHPEAGHLVAGAHLFQGGGRFFAAGGGVGAAAGKAAAGSRVDGAGDLALQMDALGLPLGLDDAGPGWGWPRAAPGYRGGAGGRTAPPSVVSSTSCAQIHDRHTVGDVLDHGKIVGHKQVGQAHLLLQVDQAG